MSTPLPATTTTSPCLPFPADAAFSPFGPVFAPTAPNFRTRASIPPMFLLFAFTPAMFTVCFITIAFLSLPFSISVSTFTSVLFVCSVSISLFSFLTIVPISPFIFPLLFVFDFLFVWLFPLTGLATFLIVTALFPCVFLDPLLLLFSLSAFLLFLTTPGFFTFLSFLGSRIGVRLLWTWAVTGIRRPRRRTGRRGGARFCTMFNLHFKFGLRGYIWLSIIHSSPFTISRYEFFFEVCRLIQPTLRVRRGFLFLFHFLRAFGFQ